MNGTAPSDFASNVLVGATVKGNTAPTRVLSRIARLARDAADAGTHDVIAAPLLEIAALVFQVHVRLKAATIEVERGAVGRPIDVGRIRWCRLSDSPRFWIPLGSGDRDVIGGVDRPWTRDIPAAAARWQATPSSMRLDPDWYARIVVLPGQSNLWCVDPDGISWSLDSGFDALLHCRRERLEPWLQSMEQFGILMPKEINKAKQRAAASGEPQPALEAGSPSSRPPTGRGRRRSARVIGFFRENGFSNLPAATATPTTTPFARQARERRRLGITHARTS